MNSSNLTQIPAGILRAFGSLGTQIFDRANRYKNHYKNDMDKDFETASGRQKTERVVLTVFAGLAAAYLTAGVVITILKFSFLATLLVIDPVLMAEDISNKEMNDNEEMNVKKSAWERFHYATQQRTLLIGPIVKAVMDGVGIKPPIHISASKV